MRPKKQINPGAHRSGRAVGKGRYYTTGLPEPDDSEWGRLEPVEPTPPTPAQPPMAEKYVGKASVGPNAQDTQAPVVIDLTEPLEWVDPLDDDEFDLSTVTIDLRSTMRNRPPDRYFERYRSKVPGHQ